MKLLSKQIILLNQHNREADSTVNPILVCIHAVCDCGNSRVILVVNQLIVLRGNLNPHIGVLIYQRSVHVGRYMKDG